MSLIRNQPLLSLKKTAFAFQKDALEIIKDSEYFAIFHEQGLGKTKIAIDLIFYWLQNNIIESVLIVSKKSLVNNWDRELDFHGNLLPIILDNNKNENLYKFNSPGFIYVCNYELIRSNLESFESFFNTRKMGIILDESTVIKTPSSKTTKALHALSRISKRRIIMTGTPISNRPYDIWSQIYFLDHGKRLGKTFDLFKEKYDLSNDLHNDFAGQLILKNNLKLLKLKLSDCSIRETKETAGLKLPGKEFILKTVGMDTKQEILYKKIQLELSAEVLKNGKIVTEDVEVILKRLLRLVQISSNPVLIDENYTNVAPKITETSRILQKAIGEKSKVIIWTNFVKNVDVLVSHFSSQYNISGIHGKISTADRDKIIRDFQSNKDADILVATPGVAREGLTLTEANYAIFYDRNFSLENYLQAQDRIYRISQEKTCYIYKLLTENSIDYWVDALLEAKEIAARFGQGDISESSYQESMRFDFVEILNEILNN